MKALFALLLLTLSAFALPVPVTVAKHWNPNPPNFPIMWSSVVTVPIGNTDVSVSIAATLGSAPPGATGIACRILDWHGDLAWGQENDDQAQACSGTMQLEHAWSWLVDDTTDICADRMYSATQGFSDTAWDGVDDHAGTSGSNWTESKDKGSSAWGYFTGIPSTVDLHRRSTNIHTGGSGAMDYIHTPHSSGHIQLQWTY